MEILLTLLTSGSLKWIVILLLSIGSAASLYISHLKSVAAEKQKTLLEYNITQLNQLVKDKDEFIKKLQDINNKKETIVSNLQTERDELNEKMKQLELEIEKISAKEDRPSSNILKTVIKNLGGQK